jgi:hypothetical protein
MRNAVAFANNRSPPRVGPIRSQHAPHLKIAFSATLKAITFRIFRNDALRRSSGCYEAMKWSPPNRCCQVGRAATESAVGPTERTLA